MEKYNKSNCHFGVNSFWVIQNNKVVIDTCNKLSNRKAAKFVTKSEFSTLYINVPDDKLIKALNSILA